MPSAFGEAQDHTSWKKDSPGKLDNIVRLNKELSATPRVPTGHPCAALILSDRQQEMRD